MIPIKLTLKNFMSYSDNEVLDFTKFHIAVVIGKNGNGKSSLWDAITWCIWGRARGLDAAGRGSDELIRIGCDEMSVEFIFKIDKVMYRILRNKHRNSTSILEFNIINSDGSLKSLTQEKIDDTRKKIEETIMLDYDTFIASSFMPQNQSGFFSEADPTKRKQIFSEVLGLGIYDKLQEKAKDRKNEIGQNIILLNDKLKLYSKEIEEKEKLIQLNDELNEKYNNKKISLETLNVQLESESNKKQKMDEKIIKIKEYEKRISIDEKTLNEYKMMLNKINRRIDELSEVLSDENEINNGYEEYKVISLKLKEFEDKYEKYNELVRQKINVVNKINTIKREIELELSGLISRYDEYNDRLLKYNQYEKNLMDYEKELKNYDLLDKTMQQVDDNIMNKNNKLVEINMSSKNLEENLKKVKDDFDTISNTDSTCPVCKTPLTKEKKEKLLLELKEKTKNLEKNIFENKSKYSSIKKELNLLKNEKNNLRKKQEEKNKITIKINTLKNKIAESNELLIKESKLKEKIDNLKNKLTNSNYGIEEKKEYDQIQKELKNLNFSLEMYKNIKEKHEQYRKYETFKEKLNSAKENISEYQKTCDLYKSNIMTYNENLINDKKMIDYLKNECLGYDKIIEKINDIKNLIQRENDEYINISVNLSTITEKLKRIKEVEEIIENINKEIELNKKEKYYYEILEYSFGKKGIQALIIENALPEFEDTANTLLAKLTDGKMYLSLITQKMNKNGNVQETLDIDISDELGKRKYELYSGGEAFRINFALRIALSKFLSKRAGVKLQTLIIDEGFGSQDDIGKQNIIEVLNNIKDEFELVIIITHLDDLKDSFPYTIEITKDQNGSHINYLS